MLLMCLSILACWAAHKTWEVYMMTAKPEDFLRFSEAKHRRRMEWAEFFGGRGKKVRELITRWLGK